ncbi:MAG TPA: phage/plasmid replication protein, II/X family, partial [Porticoccaceae bacterium]
GHDLRSTMAKNTYYRHRKELLKYGINIDLRQENADRYNVVPLVRILEAVPASIPAWAFELNLVHPSASNGATGLQRVAS